MRNIFIQAHCKFLITDGKYIEFFSGSQQIYSWKSKRMSEETIKNPPTQCNTFAPILIDYRPLLDAKFGGKCLGQVSNSVRFCFGSFIFLFIYFFTDLIQGPET